MRMFWNVIFFLSLTILNNGAPAKEENSYLLPEQNVKPVSYKIIITPHLTNETGEEKKFSFDGETEIDLDISKDKISTITLHSKKLTFESIPKLCAMEGDDCKEEIGISYKELLEVDMLQISISSPEGIKEGRYRLHFKFNGKMSDDMKGFYKSKYRDNNQEIVIGATQFQPVHARSVFPCFDEPEYRATFQITINKEKNFFTRSNTMLEKTSDTQDIYKTTPKMPTYLIAFLVHNFGEKSGANAAGVGPFAVLSRRDVIEDTKYSLEIGQELIEKLNNYTNYKYSKMEIGKMDLAAIPDFSAGAMENWGLLTFRETGLLHNDRDTSKLAEQKIASVIAHEQAHMWFGNLMTCQWWSYTWLNEGFARYFQYFILNEVKPEFKMDQQFVVDQIHIALEKDVTSITHPLNNPDVFTPADISKMFGKISYNKGASVIRMFEHILGADNFKQAIQYYIEKNNGKPVKPENLLEALSSKTNDDQKENLENVFEKFTTLSGYPIVSVEVSVDRKSFTIKQHKYNDNDSIDKWAIPITYSTKKEHFSNTSPNSFLSTDSKIFTIDEGIKWLILNNQQTGYYRVNYDENTWMEIKSVLMDDTTKSDIHELNRAQIVDDLFSFGQYGHMKYNQIFDILQFLKSENSYLTWNAAFRGLSFIAAHLEKDDIALFKSFLLPLLDNIYNKLKFEEDSKDEPLTIYNRASVLAWACKYEHEDCIRLATEKAKETDISPNIRPVVYCTDVRMNDMSAFEILWTKYKTTTVVTEKVLILNALGCIKSDEGVKQYFNKILDDEIRLQDKSAALTALYSSDAKNVDRVLNLMISKFTELKNSFLKTEDVAALFSGIAARFTTKEQKESLAKLYADNEDDLKEHKDVFDKAQKTIENNFKWRDEYKSNLIEYMKFVTKTNSSSKLSINFLLSALTTIYVTLYYLLRF